MWYSTIEEGRAHKDESYLAKHKKKKKKIKSKTFFFNPCTHCGRNTKNRQKSNIIARIKVIIVT